MAKDFAWKLDLLMKLSGISNSELGRMLGFDASYISRVRNGKRGLPTERPFIEPASALFAKRIRNSHQQAMLATELEIPWPENAERAQQVLEAWLAAKPNGGENVWNIVNAASIKPEFKPDSTHHRTNAGHEASVRFYHGNQGKRDAVTAFLTALCETGEPHSLLLHSDEDMTWLYEDDSFARTWASLLFRLVGNGGTIRIIHSISRDANDMWEAVNKWIPLYMTGAVESHYYPGTRDGVYRRTLFVAPGHSAIASASVMDATDQMLNMLIDDEDAVAALVAEFERYFALCHPLIQAAFPDSPADMARLLSEFMLEGNQVLVSHDDGKVVCAQEDGCALAANTSCPLVAFTIEEPRMAQAVWSYLQSLPEESVADDSRAHALIADIAKRLQAQDTTPGKLR